MKFNRIDFGDKSLNKSSNAIVEKAEELHTSFEQLGNLPHIMENGSYLGNIFLKESLLLYNDIISEIPQEDRRVIELSEIIAVTAITLARFTCQHTAVSAMASDFRSNPNAIIMDYKIALEAADDILKVISTLKMSSRAKELLEETKNISATAHKRLNGSKGCFIATYVYGDFDAPEVVLLRKFRDEELDKSILGRTFIQIYYYLSPKLIRVLGSSRTFKRISKIITEALIKTLNERQT
ncbi:hypothetical protein SAMN05421813_10927 [Daejeonella rubra]|uniref:Uncharacterized protein n=1 Tax=Daejeonella rubra TaxID=990371 RepID=A0A1G9S188_9SPHI|nr:CFI-box-CTERM domain-containing protein [Daejeonella rubra]SDM29182.1 hypothetical protein SAMN05421813_10927 [Daejeonella rubra]